MVIVIVYRQRGVTTVAVFLMSKALQSPMNFNGMPFPKSFLNTEKSVIGAHNGSRLQS